MKKIIFIVVAAMFALTTAAQAQNYKSWKAPKDEPDLLRASALAYVGYNFLENAPMGGVALGLNCYCVRAELDFGFSSLKTPTLEKKRHSLGYFSPSIGLSFGDKYEFYGMVGFTTWGYIATTEVTECAKDKFHKDLVHCRLKVGSNIMISDKFFVNVDLSYMIPKSSEVGYVYFDNLALRAGIGYRF